VRPGVIGWYASHLSERFQTGMIEWMIKRRNDLCVDLIERMMQPSHILHGLLPEQNPNMKSKTTTVLFILDNERFNFLMK
jgi:hypothetical protein